MMKAQQLTEFTDYQDEYLSLLFIDLDGFKAVNDEKGHDAGDHILQVVASRLKSHVKKYDIVARPGGNEFAIILHKIASDEAIRKIGKD